MFMRAWWWLADEWGTRTGTPPHRPRHFDLYRGRRVRVCLEWQPADRWTGWFAKVDQPARRLDLWIIPHKHLRGIPLHMQWRYGYLGPGGDNG